MDAQQIENLRQQLETIRNERRTAANTATRVGDALLALLSYIENGQYLRKDISDTAKKLITFLEGLNVGDGTHGIDADGNIIAKDIKSREFIAGLLDGTGYGIYTDEHGKSVAEIDKLLVRMKMIVQELEIRRLSYVGGDQVFSSAGSKIAKVETLPSGDYRCYMLADDGTTRTMNTWKVGDQARCQTMNIQPGIYTNVSNRYYWRLVVARGTVTLDDGKTYNYIDLSDTRDAIDITGEDGRTHTCVGYDTLVVNDAPQAEDSIVQLGNQIDENRQYAYIIYVTEQKRVDYSGINDYDLASHAVEQHSSDGGFVHSDFFEIVSTGSGERRAIVCDLGGWTEGMVCGHYDRVSHNGSLWLCNVGKGMTTSSEPSEDSTDWIKQVEKGDKGEEFTHLLLGLTSGDYFYRVGQETIATIEAVVVRGDTTLTVHPSQIVWTRESTATGTEDADWAARHPNIDNTLTVTEADMVGDSTTFVCTFYDENGNVAASKAITF